MQAIDLSPPQFNPNQFSGGGAVPQQIIDAILPPIKINENIQPVSKVTLERLGTAEEQAARQKLARDLMVQQQAQARALAAAQARSGVRGGAAAAQQARLAQQIAQQRAVGEEEGALQRRMFNLQQAQKEQFANVASELALRQIASSLEGQKAMAEAARQGAQAQLAIARRGKIICTELFDQGLMDYETFEADQKFAKLMRRTEPEMMLGYWILARPIVSLMKKSKLFTHIVALFALPWARHMAFEMKVRSKDSFFGRMIHKVGRKICLSAAKRRKLAHG